MRREGVRPRRLEELNRKLVFSRNLKMLLLARGPEARRSIQCICGVPHDKVNEWVNGYTLPARKTLRVIVQWAGLPKSIDLTRERLTDIEKGNARAIRKEWIRRIERMPDAVVLELQPGMDRILPER